MCGWSNPQLWQSFLFDCFLLNLVTKFYSFGSKWINQHNVLDGPMLMALKPPVGSMRSFFLAIFSLHHKELRNNFVDMQWF